MTAACPCCAQADIETLLRTPEMPVNSCVLRWSEQDSRSFPKKRMDLVGCPVCGFFWNATFQEDLLLYDADYESTQMHSGVFREYLQRTAREWLASLENEPHSILEVGCGQGEFLAALAEITAADLLGFDPSFRSDSGTTAKVIAEYLPTAPTSKFDLVITRMTLEHIGRPQDFLQNLSGWVTDDGTLITQVPNAERIMAGQQVCELFYEHVNYFTTSSLLHALERAGFHDNQVSITYEEQHLTVFSRRTGLDGKRAASETTSMGTVLPTSLERFISYWNQTLQEKAASGREIWIWGTGSRATTFLSFVHAPESLCGAIDINPLREGSFILGTSCMTFLPKALQGRRDLSIVVMNSIYKDEISAILSAISAEAELLLVNDL